MIYILAGRNREQKREICALLSKYGFSVLGSRKAVLNKCGAVIFDAGTDIEINGKNVFAVMTGGGTGIKLPDRATVLVDSTDTAGLSLLKHRYLNAVSIGMSPFDTVTVSSMTRDSAIISVQRSIPLKSGCVEPSEYKISFDGSVSVFSLAVAVIILLNENIIPK